MLNHKSHILVVDDLNTMREIISARMQAIGFTNITEAKNGIEAWKLLQKGAFDLMLLDIHMPGLDGMSLLKKVRTSLPHKTLPVIMISAESNISDIFEVKEAGMASYIVKPFSLETLKEKITEVTPNYAQLPFSHQHKPTLAKLI